jgi:hypothetical protein
LTPPICRRILTVAFPDARGCAIQVVRLFSGGTGFRTRQGT